LHWDDRCTGEVNSRGEGEIMGTSIDFKKQMSEIVYINLPGPTEPVAGMSGGELLHGFLSELKSMPDPAAQKWFEEMCSKWNIHYRENKE
jgi:hypothetical protein